MGLQNILKSHMVKKIADLTHSVINTSMLGLKKDSQETRLLPTYDLKNCGPRNRFMIRTPNKSKLICHNCGYGIGWRGFQNACANYNVILPDETCQLAVDTYRETYSEVTDLWKSLERAAMLAMTTGKECFAAHGRVSFKLLKMKNKQLFLFMKLPSGRLICYPKASIGIVKTPWGAKKKAITFRKLVNNHWAHESTYGGKLVENACQAIARDIMYVGMKNASAAGFKTIMQVYDELISLAPKGFMDIKDYENLLCNPMPEWSKGLPLEAEGKVMSRYQKL